MRNLVRLAFASAYVIGMIVAGAATTPASAGSVTITDIHTDVKKQKKGKGPKDDTKKTKSSKAKKGKYGILIPADQRAG